MTEKTKIQAIVADWKKQGSESDRAEFLAKIKAEIDAKDGAELLEGAKAIGEAVHDLHQAVISVAPETKSIEVFPNDADEAKLITELLVRMNVRFKVA